MAEDYYKTLGVNKDASQADIQKAYRDLARKHHPDLNPDDKTAKERFQQVQAAFDVLNDPSKRELYDRYGSSFEQMGAGGARGPGGRAGPGQGPGAGGWSHTTSSPEDFDFSQFFGERFGGGGDPNGGFADIFSQFRRARSGGQGGRSPQEVARGADVESEVRIPFEIAVTGGTVDLQLQRPEGRVETISVKIPPGIESGKKIRLRGQGEPGEGDAPHGDLLIKVHVNEHSYFQRRGNHLYVKVPVTLSEAAVGSKVDVPTPKGVVSIRVPPLTSSGTRLRVKGRGVEPSGKPAGDLFAEILITLPKEINDEERNWLEEFGKRHPDDPRKDLRW